MYNNKKKIVIIVMCIAIFVMITGYSLLSTRLNIRGTSNLTDTWGIKISNISYTATGRAHNIEEPTYNDTNMAFNVGVKEPGDKMVFDVTVTNYGTLDAILEKIEATTNGSRLIIYSITGIEEQSKLKGGESITFQVTTEFDINATRLPQSNKTLNIKLSYVQDDGQSLTPSNPNITDNTLLVNELLESNNAQSDGNIDFSQISSDTNGQGLYYTSTNTEDNKVTYYFRGAVENNYVSFANNTWRIIRINEDGTVRLIKQDSIGDSAFNNNNDDAAYVGYMYGTPGSTTYAATHANTNSSTIKTMIDTWYQNNLTSYSSLIDGEAGFCGDRSLSSGTGIEPTSTYYGAYGRLRNNKTPQFKCPQSNDLYTTETSTKGNKALTYPIGLITVDEVAYAGGIRANKEYYLTNRDYFWTMSPGGSGSSAGVWRVVGDYGVEVVGVGSGWGVRPVINLKSTAEIIDGGNGNLNNPYVIKTN